MEKALFSLRDYSFPILKIDFSSLGNEDTLSLFFDPSGIFKEKDKTFELNFKFQAKAGKKSIVEVTCVAIFEFNDIISFEDIPNYFFSNSIAILFPYIRAMVGTLTLQSNFPKPIVLPVMNLTSLQEQLRKQVEIRK